MYSLFSFFEKVTRSLRMLFKRCYWKLRYGKRIKIGRSFKFRKGLNINISNNGYLEIGDNCFFNNYCSINCRKKIIIKNSNIFGEGVKIYDHNHVFNNKDINIKNSFDENEIMIGNDNWFASNVIILSKANVGSNNVFGANMVVNAKYGSGYLIKAIPEIIISKIRYKGTSSDAKE